MKKVFSQNLFYCQSLIDYTNNNLGTNNMRLLFSLNTQCTLIVTIVITALISSCSSYTFESNVTADGAKQYFSARKVVIFNDETEFNAPYQYIGLVEGGDCQKEAHLALPDTIIARTKARQSAYSQQANAVIFTSCIDIITNFCTAQIVCYGKAYRLGTPYKDKEEEEAQ